MRPEATRFAVLPSPVNGSIGKGRGVQDAGEITTDMHAHTLVMQVVVIW